MSLIATLEFHLEDDHLHAHFAPLAQRLQTDQPWYWIGVCEQLERALTEYAERVAEARRRMEERLGEATDAQA